MSWQQTTQHSNTYYCKFVICFFCPSHCEILRAYFTRLHCPLRMQHRFYTTHANMYTHTRTDTYTIITHDSTIIIILEYYLNDRAPVSLKLGDKLNLLIEVTFYTTYNHYIHRTTRRKVPTMHLSSRVERESRGPSDLNSPPSSYDCRRFKRITNEKKRE